MADRPQATNVPEVFKEMPTYFQAEKAGTTRGNVQFDLSGDKGGKWWIKIADGKAEAGQGEVESPNLTLIATSREPLGVTGEVVWRLPGRPRAAVWRRRPWSAQARVAPGSDRLTVA